MIAEHEDPSTARSALLSLLSTNGTLAGISVALAGIVNNSERSLHVATIADDIFVLGALLFVVNCYLVYFAIKQIGKRTFAKLSVAVDRLLLAGLTTLLVGGFVAVYGAF